MRRPNYNDIPEPFRRAMEGEGWADNNEGDGNDGRPPDQRRPFPSPKPWWANRTTWLIGAILLIFFSFDWIVNTYTDILWFIERGYLNVWVTQWVIKAAVFAVFFVIAATVLLIAWHSARIKASRVATPMTAPSPVLINPTAVRWLVTGIALLFSLTFASAARTQWEEFLLYFNRRPYGTADPIFGLDISFYLFELPIYRFLQGWFMPLLIFAALGTIGFYALRFLPSLQNGQVTLPDVPTPLRRALAVIGTIFFLFWAVGYQLETYDLLFSPRGVVFGAGYTDVNASLLALRVQLAAVVVLAITVAVNYFKLQWKPMAAAAALWVAAAVLLNGIYPAVLQRYVVEPTELSRESEFIQHNIDFTRMAFELDKVEVRDFGSVDVLTEQDLQENEASLRNMRLWDYRPLQQTYAQLQELRPYYQFSSIDIDRYMIDGEMRQVMLAARELDKDNLQNNSWVNQKLEFTHGYGVVMNPVDRFTNQGRPEFFISDLPPKSTVDIEVTRPEIYFGETTTDIVFVGSERLEFDYASDDENNVRNTYEGRGGVPVGNGLRQLAFAFRFGESNVLFSEYIDPETRVIYYRQIQERIRTITPFLLLDGDPYLVVADGRLVWMQDAYTFSNHFPYSQPVQIGNGQLNYIRNSVKITVDAYHGDVHYYLTETDDPIIAAYQAAFPGLFKPMSSMPESLRPHIRYPEDLFTIQTNQYLTYHMTSVETFYNKEDLREIPQEIFEDGAQLLEPYYVIFRLPGEEKTEYLLIQPYTPADKPNMVAWIAARNDPEHYGELVAYELPRQQLVVGPIQIEGFIDQETTISQQFSLWDQRGSNLIRGNLIVIPLNDSFLYVEPIYLLSDTSALPELKRVIVASGEKIVMRETLDEALSALLSDEAVPIIVEDDISDVGNVEPAEDTAVEEETPTTAEEGSPATDQNFEELIQQANDQFEAAQAAQREGDWSTYGEQIEALEQTLRQLEAFTE